MSSDVPAGQEVAHRQVRYQAPPGATEILLVRHGESAPFTPGTPFALVDGHGDPPLAPQGEWQAERVGERLGDEAIDAIYVTTLRRTAQTAAPLARRLGLEPRVERDLREVFLGEWEGGVLRQKAAAQDPVYLRVQEEEDWGLIPGAESWQVLLERCRAGIGRIHAAHPDQRVAVFVHGGVIGVILAQATRSRPFAFSGADNGSIHHLVVLGDDWRVRCYNDTAHLGGFTARAQPLT